MSASLAAVRRICLALPSATERPSHGHPSWFVEGKRQFATYHGSHHDVARPHVWCAAPPGAQESLSAERPEQFFRPPYVGHRGWLGVYLDTGLGESELERLLFEAYRTVCPPRLLARQEATAEG